jgi:hypothetical protein
VPRKSRLSRRLHWNARHRPEEFHRANCSEAEADVIVLSYAKTGKEYAMTCECLRSLRASSANIRFNVVVVETSHPDELRILASGRPLFGDHCKVVFPKRDFNYNEFLQIGYRELKDTSAKHLLILNNDVVFERDFAEELLSALRSFGSVSPWCPGYHDRFFDPCQPFHEGYRISYKLCGWALMFTKDLLNRVAFEELFPREFVFWYQDNYYASQLRRLGVRHALVTAAKVHHLFRQSRHLIEPGKRHALTFGARRVLAAKLAEDARRVEGTWMVPSPPVPSQPGALFPLLTETHAPQAEQKSAETALLMDNKRAICAHSNAPLEPADGADFAGPSIRPIVSGSAVPIVAILGMYRSGASRVAGILHTLGVYLGEEFRRFPHKYSRRFFENRKLAQLCRRIYAEPMLDEVLSRPVRIGLLSEWGDQHRQEASNYGILAGGKHPILSLLGSELVEAWGESTRFIATHRNFEDAVSSLAECKWKWDRRAAEVAQRRLRDACDAFLSRRSHLAVDAESVRSEPRKQVARIVEFLDIEVTQEQMDDAIAAGQRTLGLRVGEP